MKTKAIVVWCFVIAIILQGVQAGYGYNPGDAEKVQKTKACQKCDLSGANLSFANLSGANLSGANLSGAILDGATWTDGSTCENGSIGRCKK